MLANKLQRPNCAVIIVTHNNELHIEKVMHSLENQTFLPSEIVIIDSGSTQPDYLFPYQHGMHRIPTKVIFEDNIGFCKGNNLGVSRLPSSTEYILFLNPDTFLTTNFIEKAIALMENPSNQLWGMLSGTLLGYDIIENRPTDKYDSTGIFQKWYGRWYDRDQGTQYQSGKYQYPEAVKALCGALLFCRKKALDSILLNGSDVFDNSFFMYKEDIDLSLRLKKTGYLLMFIPELIAYHCRGWKKDRRTISRKLRLHSAKNEITLHMRSYSPFVVYSMLKYLYVRIFNR